jgi:hypothetical protein
LRMTWPSPTTRKSQTYSSSTSEGREGAPARLVHVSCCGLQSACMGLNEQAAREAGRASRQGCPSRRSAGAQVTISQRKRCIGPVIPTKS